MLTETGKIVRLDGNIAWVETMRQSVCGACQARKGCGQNLLNQLTGTTSYLRLSLNSNAGDVGEGDQVEIGIEEGAVVAASLLAYGLPLFLLMFSIVLAGLFQFAGFWTFIACVAGLSAGITLNRLLIKHCFRASFFEPVLIRRIPHIA
jgi:Positive regulator of sigma E activity